MAKLGRWTGGSITIGNLPETWGTPNGLFPTEAINDDSLYSWNSSTSTLTLPASGLADAYLFVAHFEVFDDGARFSPQLKIIKASGTGDFVGPPAGGYLRDASEDRAFVRCWAVVHNPSASSTYQVQWKGDTDDIDASDTSESSAFEVIPLPHANIGMYTSASAALYGGTSPNQVTGWSSVYESDTASIELVSNVVTIKQDNKDYFILGGQFWEGRVGRTQRWGGLEIDNTQENAAKSYSYYKQASADENGHIFTWLIRRATTNITIEQTCYRGDGVANGQGGADGDGSTPAVGDHGMVIFELNSSAEVFRSVGSTNQNFATTGPIDCQLTKTTDIDFNDSASFTRASDTGMNVEVAADVLLAANISCASENVGNNSRWTAKGEFIVNGVEQGYTENGNYLRGNSGSSDCYGWSVSLLSAVRVSANDDVGVSITEHSGTEGGGDAVHLQVGWGGFLGLNLDTLEGTGPQTVSPSAIASLEAFGSPTLDITYTIGPAGAIASAEAFGATILDITYTITASGITSVEAFGSPTLVPGVVNVIPSAIDSLEAFGSHVLDVTYQITPTGIASLEAFGAATIAPTNIISPSAIASLEAFGTTTIVPGVVTIIPSGIASGEVVPSPTVSFISNIFPTGIASDEAFGTTTLLLQYTISPTGIVSAEVVPNPTIGGLNTIIPSAIASLEAFGTAQINTLYIITPTGISSDELFGSPAVLAGAITITPNGIATLEIFGSPTIGGLNTITPNAIASDEAFGAHTVDLLGTGQTILPNGIISFESFGSPIITGGVTDLPVDILKPILKDILGDIIHDS